jgi:hypothetical protein
MSGTVPQGEPAVPRAARALGHLRGAYARRVGGPVRYLAVLVLATLLVALVLLTAWHTVATGSLGEGFPVAARTLFFFGDIAFYLWIPFLVIAAARLRRRPAPLVAFLVLLAGGVLNVAVVAGIGFVQTGGLADFVVIAVEGSLASVLAGAVIIPLLYRVPAPVEPSRDDA